MIDTHLHILPGVDDGPETIEEALALARALVQEGIHTAIATPHFNDMFPQRSAVEIKARVSGLQQVLNYQHIPELWNQSQLPEVERVIFELRAFGITPILAHPERYSIFQKEPERLGSLLRQGVLAQITASSLVGMQGRTAQRTAQTLLKQGLVHCIASDAHGLHKRPPAIVQSLGQAVQVIGQEKTQQLIEGWPMTIINNVPCRV